MSTLVESIRIPADEYHAVRALSNSGLSDLAVSPLRYWYLNVNPNRPREEPTPSMDFGTALHCAVLEPEKFDSRYCQRVEAADHHGCLVTIEDIRAWLTERGEKPKGTKKGDLINQALIVDPNVPILDVIRAIHESENGNKKEFASDVLERIRGAANALRNEPRVQEILAEGQAEQSFFVDCDGVPLKARMDWTNAKWTLDLKVLTACRDRAFDREVSEAIWYRGYYRQGYFYSLVRALANSDHDVKGPQRAPRFVFAFVESDPPHEVRIREFRPIEAGSASLLWERARFEVKMLMDTYREYSEKFGEKEWRYAQESEALTDEEFPALVYGR